MGLKSSADVGFLLLAGRSILGRVTTLTDTEEALVEETTPLGAADDTWAPVGQTKWTLAQDGFYDTAVGAINEALELTGEQVLMFALTGNAIGEDFLGANDIRTTYEKGTARGTLHKVKSQHVSDEGPDRGWVAAHHTARTTLGPTSTATLDPGVAYANQQAGSIVAYLGVSALALDGGTGLVVVVRDSSDDITYADLVTFTTVVAAPAAERKTLAAAAPPNDIERYIQVQHTFTGASGAARSATFAVGVSRPLA